MAAESARVLVRVRPFNTREGGTARCLRCEGDSGVAFSGGEAPGGAGFAFDRVFGEAATQADVFDELRGTVQAVLQGRAYANLSGNTVIKYSASRTPQYIATEFAVPGSRFHWGTPFRLGDTAARDAMERVMECMKRDGTMARLSEKWFGSAPKADDGEVTIFPGFGVPGMPGYDPTPHEVVCR